MNAAAVSKSSLPAGSLLLVVSLLALAGCQTIPDGTGRARLAQGQSIQAEAPGDYFIGRRYYKKAFHFWGYLRRPGQPWNTAQLVVFNEQEQLAPDREALALGSDNNYEYKLRGHFTGDKVYELVSDRFLPEFVLQGYELISIHPAPIFKSQLQGRPEPRMQIEKPE